MTLRVNAAADLDVAALLTVVDGRRLELGAPLLTQLRANRTALLERLRSGEPVYGVNTGMGAASDIRLDDRAQAQQQDNLLRGRSVGAAPWLDRREARAALAFRLRDFLAPEAAVSAELCLRIVALLNADAVPAMPRTGSGAAGEIIPLAHLGEFVTGAGDAIRNGVAVPASGSFALGPKEGVAMLEGIPVTTALAALLARDARRLRDQYVAVTAAGLAIIGANTDPYQPVLARADPELATVFGAVRELLGEPRTPRLLQAPVSFRVAGPALAHVARAIDTVDAAVTRAVEGVTDSPAFLRGQFLGTTGFDGFDLAAGLDFLRMAVLRLVEISAARLHRLLDSRITGLSRQLSAQPGLHAGMVTVHKRVVGLMHALPTGPTVLRSVETSLGQEDVQSFSLESAQACRTALHTATDVLAGELLGLVQAVRIAAEDRLAGASADLVALLNEVSSALPPGTEDRPYGRDTTAIAALLNSGWASRPS